MKSVLKEGQRGHGPADVSRSVAQDSGLEGGAKWRIRSMNKK